MDDIELFLSILITGFSFLLMIVSTGAYIRVKSIKFLLIDIAFLCFFIKAILAILSIVYISKIALIIDMIIITLFYVSIVKK